MFGGHGAPASHRLRHRGNFARTTPFAGRSWGKSQVPATTLNWYCDQVKVVEPVPLGKQRSRDAKDDPYLACALAAGAKIIVSRDDDLLALQKPFGIQIITPRELLTKLAKPF